MKQVAFINNLTNDRYESPAEPCYRNDHYLSRHIYFFTSKSCNLRWYFNFNYFNFSIPEAKLRVYIGMADELLNLICPPSGGRNCCNAKFIIYDCPHRIINPGNDYGHFKFTFCYQGSNYIPVITRRN